MAEVKSCSASRAVQTHYITVADVNAEQHVHGGRLMKMIDMCAGATFAIHAGARGVTASVDSLNFFEAIEMDQLMLVESYVTGTGRYSVETFVKVSGEDMHTGNKFLAATAFLTFVAVAGKDGVRQVVPSIQPVTGEEQYICAGYQERVAARKTKRELNRDFNQQIVRTPPWAEAEH